MTRRSVVRLVVGSLLVLLTGAGLVALVFPEVVEALIHGESRQLREAEARPGASDPRRAKLLVLAIDGVDRAQLYAMLRAGELPGFAHMLGGREGDRFPHAHLDETVLSTMPSSTIPAWATTFTGVPPAVHGVSGNEFFVREKRQLAAPAPVSFTDSEPILSIYSDDYADQLLAVPTIFERMRAEDPGVRIWVSMGHFHRGADRLLTAKRSVLAEAFTGFLEHALGDEDARDVYASLDQEVLDTVDDSLEESAGAPDVLTIYLAGNDLYAHHAEQGPDAARRAYLREVLDPEIEKLYLRFQVTGVLEDRYVVLVSDHGHTDVLADEAHALGTEGDGEPPAVLRAAGFRVRPFELEVADDHDFQAVMAYGGATAFVYLADRSTCAQPGQRCDFTRPPRYEEDVLVAAEAFFRASRDGVPAAMRGTLDMILVRRAVPHDRPDLPFQVYLGDGRLEDVDAYVARVHGDRFVSTGQRLIDLAVGPLGERAGDLMLITRNGGEASPADRYYFSTTYQSWHGSPSRKDSEVPFIVAHHGMSSAELAARVGKTLGERPRLQHVGQVLLELRSPGARVTPAARR